MNRVLIVVTALLASLVSDGAKKLLLSTPRKRNVPYIKCQVCEKLTSRLHQLVKEKKLEISPKKISEYEIIEIAENVCNFKKEEADWIIKIDIVEKEYIYESRPDLVSLVNAHPYKDLTDVCSKNPPLVPKDRVPGKPFVAKPSKDVNKIMRSMQGTPGAPVMKVYSKKNVEKYEKILDEARHEIDVLVSVVKQVKKHIESSMVDWEMRYLSGVKDVEKMSSSLRGRLLV